MKSVEPKRAAVDAPKPVVAPKLAPPAPVEVAPPAVVVAAPREVPAPPTIQVKPIESAAPALVVDAPKPPPEPPKGERAATPTAIAGIYSRRYCPGAAGHRRSDVAVAVAPTPVVEKAPLKQNGEQLALLGNKPTAAALAKPPIARAAPKPLEGFIIQLAFNDKDRAQRWAEGMEKKGYAVSVTEAGAEGALRVRLGNFVLRDDAERQLRTIKQEGLNGIILNLPQAFRPEARTSIP